MTTTTEAREIIQPVIDGCNAKRDYVLAQARKTRNNKGDIATARILIERARYHNNGARAMLRELRRLEAAK